MLWVDTLATSTHPMSHLLMKICDANTPLHTAPLQVIAWTHFHEYLGDTTSQYTSELP